MNAGRQIKEMIPHHAWMFTAQAGESNLVENKCTPAQKIRNSDNNGDGGSATQEVLTRWRFRGQQYPSLQVREALSRLWYSLGFTNCDLARFLHTSPTRGSAESTSHAHLHIFITINRCSLFPELYRKLELLRKLPALGRDPDLSLLAPSSHSAPFTSANGE